MSYGSISSMIDDIYKVIDYLYHDEEKDYAECKCSGEPTDNHIFNNIKRLAEYVNYIPATEDDESCEEVSIMWDDLTEKAKAEILRVFGENGNYDVFPIVTLEKQKEI